MAGFGILIAERERDAAYPAAVAERSLRLNFVWALAGNVFYSAAQWAMIVILARLGDPTIVGRFALGLAITSPILTLTNLQLRTVQATDVGARFCCGHYVALRLLGTAVFLLSVVVAALGGGCDRTMLAVLCAVAAMKAAESLSDVTYGLLHANERLDRIAQSQILKAVVAVCAMLVTIGLTRSYQAGIAALTFAFWLTLVTFDVAIVARTAGPGLWLPVWNGRRIRELLRLSLPLGFTLLLVSLNANLPRYFLKHYRGVGEVGVFSALAYVTVSTNLFVMALGQALAPRMAKACAADRRAFTRLSARLFAVAASVGGIGLAAAVVAGKSLLQILYGAEYAREHRVFVCLMFSGMVSHLASAAGYSLTSARFFRAQFPILLAVCAVTAAVCAWLVPGRGLAGAAVAQAGGYAVQLGACLAYLVCALRRGPLASGDALPAGDFLFRREV